MDVQGPAPASFRSGCQFVGMDGFPSYPSIVQPLVLNTLAGASSLLISTVENGGIDWVLGKSGVLWSIIDEMLARVPQGSLLNVAVARVKNCSFIDVLENQGGVIRRLSSVVQPQHYLNWHEIMTVGEGRRLFSSLGEDIFHTDLLIRLKHLERKRGKTVSCTAVNEMGVLLLNTTPQYENDVSITGKLATNTPEVIPPKAINLELLASEAERIVSYMSGQNIQQQQQQQQQQAVSPSSPSIRNIDSTVNDNYNNDNGEDGDREKLHTQTSTGTDMNTISAATATMADDTTDINTPAAKADTPNTTNKSNGNVNNSLSLSVVSQTGSVMVNSNTLNWSPSFEGTHLGQYIRPLFTSPMCFKAMTLTIDIDEALLFRDIEQDTKCDVKEDNINKETIDKTVEDSGVIDRPIMSISLQQQYILCAERLARAVALLPRLVPYTPQFYNGGAESTSYMTNSISGEGKSTYRGNNWKSDYTIDNTLSSLESGSIKQGVSDREESLLRENILLKEELEKLRKENELLKMTVSKIHDKDV